MLTFVWNSMCEIMQQPAINTDSCTKYVRYFSDDIFKCINFI